MAGRFFRGDFDRDREFVALRSFVFSAQAHLPGQVVAKEKFTVRRLRQLFDNRYIGYPSEIKKVKAPGSVPDWDIPDEAPVVDPTEATEASKPLASPRVPRRRLNLPTNGVKVAG